MYCKTHETRVKILSQYDVKPLCRVKMAEGDTIRGDAGRDITDEYYKFVCKGKYGQREEIITVGWVAAKDLLEMTGNETPKLINIFKGESVGKSGSEKGSKNGVSTWNPVAQQLYHAWKLLIIMWGLNKPSTYDFLISLEKYYYCTPFIERIRHVNNTLHKHNTSMREEIIKFEKKKKQPLMQFKFDLLEKQLHDKGDLSYFEDSKGR